MSVLATQVDDSQVNDIEETQRDIDSHEVSAQASQPENVGPEGARPEGETMLTVPELPLAEPLVKRPRIHITENVVSNEEIPVNFRVKWVKTTDCGLIPFVRNESTGIVHCGKTRMKVFSTDGIATVMCMKGCHWQCSGHKHDHCGCHCHVLQWHYNSRGY